MRHPITLSHSFRQRLLTWCLVCLASTGAVLLVAAQETAASGGTSNVASDASGIADNPSASDAAPPATDATDATDATSGTDASSTPHSRDSAATAPTPAPPPAVLAGDARLARGLNAPRAVAANAAVGPVAAATPSRPSPAKGAAPPTANADDGGKDIRTVVRERTVYVPYEKLEDVFESEDRGIFLPYKEFLEIWRKSLPKPPQPEPDEPPADAVVRSASYAGSVEGDAARFQVTYHIEALKEGWTKLALPLDGVAVESIEHEGALLVADTAGYSVFLPRRGHYEVSLRLSVHVQSQPGKKTLSFDIPATALSRLELSVPEKDVRVQVEPKSAVLNVEPSGDATQVVAFLGNASKLSLSWLPPAGRAADGGSVLTAEQAVHTYLGERVLKSTTRLRFRILRGEQDTFRVQLPEDMRLIAVRGKSIREWTQEENVLVVQLHAPVKHAYELNLRFERILAATPESLSVPFARAEGVLRESGYVVVGHESGLHIRVATATGLSQLDPDEVPDELRAQLGIGFQFVAHPVHLQLQVEKILPVIRAHSVSVLTLGQEEDSWVGWVDFDISKAGVFRLQLRIPERWSVTSMDAGGNVEDFQLGDPANGQRIVTVSLKSKAMNKLRLPFRFSADGTIRDAGERSFSVLEVVGVEQSRGLFGVSTPRAYDVVTLEREALIDADIDELFRSGIMSQVGSENSIPRAYRFRAQPASVRLRLEAKNTEVDVLAQHLIEVADGNIKVAHMLDYNILYAAVDRLQFRTPESIANVPEKVEVENKKEIRSLGAENGSTLWELTFQTPVIGSVTLTLTHEMDLKGLTSGQALDYAVPMLRPEGVRTERGFVAVQKKGTLEIVPQPENMESVDPSDLPDKLRRGAIYSAFRYFSASPTLTLKLTHYQYESLATAVVNLLYVKSVLSEENKLKSEATLIVQNTDRQYLEVELGDQAEIFSLTVAGKPQAPNKKRRDSNVRLIPIPQSAGNAQAFPVVIVYEEQLGQKALGSIGKLGVRTLEVQGDVPVAKVELDLYLPPDYAYLWWSGNVAHETPTGLWPRFKRLLSSVVDTDGVVGKPAVAQKRQRRAAAPSESISVNLPTRNLKPVRLETLAPVAALNFTYVGRDLFTFVDLAALAIALAGGYFMIKRLKWSKLKVTAALIIAPLVLSWFAHSAVTEVYTSVFAGGALLAVYFGTLHAIAATKEWFATNGPMTPDPFLEGETVDAVVLEPEQLDDKSFRQIVAGQEDKAAGSAIDESDGDQSTTESSSPESTTTETTLPPPAQPTSGEKEEAADATESPEANATETDAGEANSEDATTDSAPKKRRRRKKEDGHDDAPEREV